METIPPCNVGCIIDEGDMGTARPGTTEKLASQLFDN